MFFNSRHDWQSKQKKERNSLMKIYLCISLTFILISCGGQTKKGETIITNFEDRTDTNPSGQTRDDSITSNSENNSSIVGKWLLSKGPHSLEQYEGEMAYTFLANNYYAVALLNQAPYETGSYTLNNNRIKLNTATYTFNLQGNTLTLTDLSGASQTVWSRMN